MSTEDDNKRRVMVAMGRYFSRVESSKSFREQEEEKREYATRGRKKKSKRGCPSEYQEHTALVGVLRRANCNFLHPNNNARGRIAGKRAQSLGVVKGAADLIVFTTPPNQPSKKGVCLEIKALDGRPSKEQIGWLQGMHRDGFLSYVVWGCDAGIDLLLSLGYLKEFKHHGPSNDTKRTGVPEQKSARVSSYQEIQSVPSGGGDDPNRSGEGDGDE